MSPLAIPYNSSIQDTVSPGTDLDYYVFEGVANTDIRITVLSSITDGLDPRLELRDPEGTTVIDSSCLDNSSGHTCSFHEDLTLNTSGVYTMIFTDSGIDEIGNYEVNLQCLFGECPDQTARFSFETNLLSIPVVDVPEVGTFSVNLELPADTPNANEFVLTNVTQVSGTLDAIGSFSPATNLLHIPRVEVFLGELPTFFEVDMRAIVGSIPLRFELLNATRLP